MQVVWDFQISSLLSVVVQTIHMLRPRLVPSSDPRLHSVLRFGECGEGQQIAESSKILLLHQVSTPAPDYAFADGVDFQ